MVVAEEHHGQLDLVVASGAKRIISRVDLHAQIPEKLHKRLACLHAFVCERDKAVGGALLQEVDLVVVAQLPVVSSVGPRLNAITIRRLHMFASDEVLRPVNEATKVASHHHGCAFSVLLATLLQRHATLADRLRVVRDKVEEGGHLVSVEQPPSVDDYPIVIHNPTELEGGSQAKLAMKMPLHDVLPLLADALGLLLVRGLLLTRRVGGVEPREPRVAQHTTFERDALLCLGEGYERS